MRAFVHVLDTHYGRCVYVNTSRHTSLICHQSLKETHYIHTENQNFHRQGIVSLTRVISITAKIGPIFGRKRSMFYIFVWSTYEKQVL